VGWDGLIVEYFESHRMGVHPRQISL
jgi:hypothetical protein